MATSEEFNRVMSPYQDDCSVPGGVKLPPATITPTPFRPDAPIFDPNRNKTLANPSREVLYEEPQSPWYPLPIDTFLPPETPRIGSSMLREEDSPVHKFPVRFSATPKIQSPAAQMSSQMNLSIKFNPEQQHFANEHDTRMMNASKQYNAFTNPDFLTHTSEVANLASTAPHRKTMQEFLDEGANMGYPNTMFTSAGMKPPVWNSTSATLQDIMLQGHSRHVSLGSQCSISSDDIFAGTIRPRSQSLHTHTPCIEPQAGAIEDFQSETLSVKAPASPNFSMQRSLSSLSNDSNTTETPQRALIMRSGSNESSSAEQSPDRTRAKYLANIIRNGLTENSMELSNNPRLTTHSRQTSTSSSVISVPTTPTTLRLATPPKNIGPDLLVRQYMLRGRPSLEDAFNNIPLVEECRGIQAAVWGVVRISDIPYGTTKPEVVAALGRKSRIAHMPLGSPFFAIHIIMERSTAKSMDCYVEFETTHEAQYAVQRFRGQISNGHHPRIGDRKIQMEVVGQEVLMKELFPKARNVDWQGQTPVIRAPEDGMGSKFNGFVTGEEMVMTAKFAEYPQRSRFAQRHEQRVYESVISLVAKYPWFAVEACTLEERDRIFDTTLTVTRSLADQLRRGYARRPLTIELLQELLHAGLVCPGFSEVQRAKLVEVTQDLIGASAYVSVLATVWPFEVLKRKVDASEELLMYYVALLREAADMTTSSPVIRRGIHRMDSTFNSPFGNFTLSPVKNKKHITFAQKAVEEWEMVEGAFRQLL